MKKFALIVVSLFISSTAAASTVAFDTQGKCEINGVIHSFEHVDAYTDPCVANKDCPVGAFIPSRPSMYMLSVEIQSISCSPEGKEDPFSYHAQFQLDKENTIVVYQEDIKKGDAFEVGDNISGTVEFQALQHKFTNYTLIKGEK